MENFANLGKSNQMLNCPPPPNYRAKYLAHNALIAFSATNARGFYKNEYNE